MTNRLKIHESAGADGTLTATVVVRERDGLFVQAGAEQWLLDEALLESVFARYGAPLDASERVDTIATLDLGADRSLEHVRHLARFDVIARDFLVYRRPGHEPSCAIATTIAGALAYVARAQASQ